MLNEGAVFSLSINSSARLFKANGAVVEARLSGGGARRGGVTAGSGGRIGSGGTSLTLNMGSIGELFMDGYIRFGRRSKRLV